MKLLLTGSSGFIGSYFQSNYGDKYDISTFSFQNDNFHKLDLNQVNTIIHLSALVHQMGGADENEYKRINVDNTIALAQKAKQNGVKQFIFMSSVKVYGEIYRILKLLDVNHRMITEEVNLKLKNIFYPCKMIILLSLFSELLSSMGQESRRIFKT